MLRGDNSYRTEAFGVEQVRAADKEGDVFHIPAAVVQLCATLVAAGARVLVIGGAVVDMLLERVPADWDLEVHGLTESEVLTVLTDYRPKAVKAEHNGHHVLKCSVGSRLIIDGPREHREPYLVDITVPDVDEVECARRRDLTINSVFLVVDTEWSACGKVYRQAHELVDHFGCQAALKEGRLEPTSEYFEKTPANVLRIAHFLSRGKGHFTSEKTFQRCRAMAPMAHTIPSELVKTHLDKLLMGWEPDAGLEFLEVVDWLWALPVLAPLAALDGLEEKPEWHPEGDAWDHTVAVVGNAAKVREQLPEEWRLPFMWAALLHDVGKAAVDVGDCSYHGHDKAGEALAQKVMEDLKASKDLTAKVVALVGNHMQCGGLTRGEARTPAWKRLHNKVRLDVAGWLSRCDWAAHPDHDVDDASSHRPSKLAFQYFEEFGPERIPPKILGRHLIRAGLKPGPRFRLLLEQAFELQLANPDWDETMLLDTLLTLCDEA